MKYALYISFPLDIKTMIEDTDKVSDIVGKAICGAGSGFGDRDVDYMFDGKGQAVEAMQKFLASDFFKERDCDVLLRRLDE